MYHLHFQLDFFISILGILARNSTVFAAFSAQLYTGEVKFVLTVQNNTEKHL